MKSLVKDPVCGMQVEPDMYAVEYLQSRYAFCSSQCRDRFLAHPHLYIGFPGQKAPKQEGREVLKHRHLRIAQPLTPSQAKNLSVALSKVMGIKSVEIDGDTIKIVYDLLQTTAESIEARLDEIGVLLGEGWAEKLHRVFVHNVEDLEIDSLEVHKNRL